MSTTELDLEDQLLPATGSAGWIHSRVFDLSFFVFSPLLGFALAASLGFHGVDPLLMAATNYLIGVPHYLASFGFFGDGENRAYAREHRFAFFVVPLMICATVLLMYLAGMQQWVHSVIFVWNIYHVSSQSTGILSLYRKLSGGRFQERVWSHRFLLCSNAAMAFWFLEGFPPLFGLLAGIDPALPGALRYVFLAGALVTGAGYAREVARRGFGLSAGEAASLTTGLVLFVPYLLAPEANTATFAMLVGHFIQYLAIVWILSRRKYAARDPQAPQARGERLLAAFGRSWRGVAVFMLVVGVLFGMFEQGTKQLHLYVVFMIAFNSLALTHFYVDGMIWAFKNPFIRRTVAPYLTLDAHRLR